MYSTPKSKPCLARMRPAYEASLQPAQGSSREPACCTGTQPYPVMHGIPYVRTGSQISGTVHTALQCVRANRTTGQASQLARCLPNGGPNAAVRKTRCYCCTPTADTRSTAPTHQLNRRNHPPVAPQGCDGPCGAAPRPRPIHETMTPSKGIKASTRWAGMGPMLPLGVASPAGRDLRCSWMHGRCMEVPRCQVQAGTALNLARPPSSQRSGDQRSCTCAGCGVATGSSAYAGS